MVGKIYRNWNRANGILMIVVDNPGIQYSKLAKLSGLANGVLSHYLTRMEKTNLLRITRQKGGTFVFPYEIEEKLDDTIIWLRKETSCKILVFLTESNTATFQEIRDASKKSPSTVSLALTHLIEAGLVRRIFGIAPKYELKNRDFVVTALEKIKPHVLDTAKDRFSDTFSFL